MTRRINDGLSVRLRMNYIDQVSSDSGVEQRDTWSTDIGIVWAPWHGTRMAQR